MESLHKIRDVKHLEDVESTKRMQDVCDLIPESVEGLDFAKAGWYRACYQRFTNNLDRLKPAVESSHPTSPKPCSKPASSHLTRKRAPKRSLEKSPFPFPHDKCLFCDKKTITEQDKKEHLTKTFPDWSHISSGWKNIGKMAKEMQKEGYGSLLRKVTGVDLFAGQAHFHKSCYYNFHS